MPACIDEDFCKDSSLPLDGHHASALCLRELHGICGRFYNEDSIKFQNICFSCKVVLDRKNFDNTFHGYPPLPCPLTQQQVKKLLPDLKWRVVDLGVPDDTSVISKPSRHYPKVGGHRRPPIVPNHGKATQ
jgi:hypothetical protein